MLDSCLVRTGSGAGRIEHRELYGHLRLPSQATYTFHPLKMIACEVPHVPVSTQTSLPVPHSYQALPA